MLASPQDCADSGKQPRRAIAGILAATVLITLWELTYPLHFSSTPTGPWLGDNVIHKIDTLGNVIAFIPWSLAAAWLFQTSRWRVGRTMIVVTLIGFGISLLAETLQVWLPGRDSSALDLATNSIGSAIGAAVGYRWAPRLSGWLEALGRQTRRWPWFRRLGWALLAVVVVQWAPLDLAPQTGELRLAYSRALASGAPLSTTRAWIGSPANYGTAVDTARVLEIPLAVVAELGLAAASLLVFAAFAYIFARCIREHFEAKGDRSSPAPFVVPLVGVLACLTEVLKLAIRSRTPNATDAAAAIVGVLMGVVMDAAVNAARRARRRQEASGR